MERYYALLFAASLLAGCNLFADFADEVPRPEGGADFGASDADDLLDANGADDAGADSGDAQLDARLDAGVDDASGADMGPVFREVCLGPKPGIDGWYAGPNAVSGAAGTRLDPMTIEEAVAAASPGDEVILLPGIYDDSVFIDKSGTPGAPIVIRAEDRHDASFVLPGNDVAVRISNASHVHVHGLRLSNSSARWLRVENASNIVLSDLRFENHDGVAVPAVITGSNDVAVFDSSTDLTRKFVLFDVQDSRRVLLDGNHFGLAAGAAVRVQGSEAVVLRNNTFINSVGLPFQVDTSSRVLVERNYLTTSIEGPNISRSCATVRASQFMLRRNVFAHNWGLAIEANLALTDVPSDHLRIHHNVFADTADESFLDGEGFYLDGGGAFSDVVVANNAFARNGGNTSRQIRADELLGEARFDHNLLWDDTDPTVHLEYQTLEVAEAEMTSAFRDNVVGDPFFESPRQDDYRPGVESALIDAARPLASVTEDATDSTTVVVDDPYSFFDGWNIEQAAGDVVMVGGQEATVLSVDVQSGEVGLDRPVTVSAGDPVSDPWAGVAPDIGAFETGLSGARISLSNPSPLAQEAVEFDVELPDGIVPVQMEWRAGDGTIYCERSPQHIWQEPGNYSLRLVVLDSAGNKHRLLRVVRVSTAQVDPFSLEFALDTIRENLCDGTPQTYTDNMPGYFNIAQKSGGEGYECVP